MARVAVVVGFAMVGAAVFRVTSPVHPPALAVMTAVAIPRTVVVGERTAAYGAVVNDSGIDVDRRFIVCDGMECQTTGWGVVPSEGEWHGFAGALEPSLAGQLGGTWLIAEPMGGTVSQVSAIRTVVVVSIDPEDARETR